MAVAAALTAPAMAAEDGSPSLPASRQLAVVPSDLSSGASLNLIGIHGTASVPGATGEVDSTAAGTITVSIKTKAPSLVISGTASTHYLRVEGKSYSITSVAGTGPYVFTVSGSITAAANDYAELIAIPTLNDVLGGDNKFGLDEGPFGDPVFDQVFVSDGGVLTPYKYNSNLNSWATLADVPANPTVSPDAGLVVKRTAGGGAGIVPVSAFTNTDNHVVTFNEGLNIYSWPFGVAATLDDITSAIDGGPFGDPVFDVVFVESGGVITQYKYNPNLNSWATLADVPVVGGTIQIGAGTAFLVNRPAGVGSTDLSIALPITD